VFEYPTEDYPALRIYNVDYLHHVRSYVRPEGMISRGLVWDDVLAMMETMPFQAPDSFFV
ncbi:MAG: hypothetical protein AAF653_16260, partial [Chloroflexota bacterium]